MVLSGINQPNVNVVYAGGSQESFRSLYRELENSQNRPTIQLQEQLQQQAEHIATLEQKIQNTPNHTQLLKELQVQFPDAQQLFIGTGEMSQKNDEMNWQSTQKTFIWLELSASITDADRQKLHDWLKVRLEREVQLMISYSKDVHLSKTR